LVHPERHRHHGELCLGEHSRLSGCASADQPGADGYRAAAVRPDPAGHWSVDSVRCQRDANTDLGDSADAL